MPYFFLFVIQISLMVKSMGVQYFTLNSFHFKKSFMASYFLPTGPLNPYSKGTLKKILETIKLSSSSSTMTLDKGSSKIFIKSSSLKESSPMPLAFCSHQSKRIFTFSCSAFPTHHLVSL